MGNSEFTVGTPIKHSQQKQEKIFFTIDPI